MCLFFTHLLNMAFSDLLDLAEISPKEYTKPNVIRLRYLHYQLLYKNWTILSLGKLYKIMRDLTENDAVCQKLYYDKNVRKINYVF